MKLSNRIYDQLKWLSLVCLPALGVFVQSVGESLPEGWAQTSSLWLNALGVLIGSLLQVSNRQYRKYERERKYGARFSARSI